MIYYGTILLFFIVLTVATFVIGLVFRSKYIRYFLWFISLVFFVLTISTIINHSIVANNEQSKFEGLYKIDVQKSIYKNGNLLQFQNLTMRVNSDNTFVFSDSSLFISQKGDWEFEDTEDGGFVESHFLTENYSSLVFTGANFWGFQHGCFKNSGNDDVIYFKKIEK